MTTKEFLDYCKENNLKCTVNEDHSQHQHVSGENVVNNDFHSPCKEGEKTCSTVEQKDSKTIISQVCKPNDENC